MHWPQYHCMCLQIWTHALAIWELELPNFWVLLSQSPAQLFDTPWSVVHQVLLSVGFPRQEYWSGLPYLPPGDLPEASTKVEKAIHNISFICYLKLCSPYSEFSNHPKSSSLRVQYVHLKPAIPFLPFFLSHIHTKPTLRVKPDLLCFWWGAFFQRVHILMLGL